MNDLIEVDGKWYDSNLNEVSAPKTPVSYTDATWNVTFTEGQEYGNFYGTYRVEAILPDRKMMVRYTVSAGKGIEVGDVKTYPIAAQAETIAKAEKQRKAEMAEVQAYAFSEAKDGVTLAYIRAHGRIRVDVPEHSKASFAARYQRITGDRVENHVGDGFHTAGKDKSWGVTMRAIIPMLADMSVLSLPREGLRVVGNQLEIIGNDYVWGLFYKGFRIGRNDAVAA